jgi:hypothetical protein
MIGLPLDDIPRGGGNFRRHSGLQQSDGVTDGCERIPELMSQYGEELILALFGIDQLPLQAFTIFKHRSRIVRCAAELFLYLLLPLVSLSLFPLRRLHTCGRGKKCRKGEDAAAEHDESSPQLTVDHARIRASLQQHTECERRGDRTKAQRAQGACSHSIATQ